MNCSASRPVADRRPQPSDPEVLWSYPVFCQIGLPLAAAEGPWQRQVDSMAVALTPVAEGALVPSGWALRRFLLHLCDQAVRTSSPVVELGEDATALAAALGLPVIEPVLQEVAVQVERFVAMKLTVSQEGQAPLGMLDARGQSHRAAPAWRSRLRLSSRFHASLMQHAVPLDRRIVMALAAEPLALDAHGWIRHLLCQQTADQPITVAWDDLFRRFGAAGQEMDTFRAAFEDALRMVYAADHSIALAADAAGVTVGFATTAPDAEPVAAEPAPPAPGDASAAVGAAPSAGRQEALAQAVAPEPAEGDGRTSPDPQTASAGSRSLADPVSLRSHLTGLPGVIWLRRGRGDEPPVIGVTPGARWDPDRLTVLLLEPLIMQITGGLPQKEFDAVSAWAMANRDLIDLVWDGRASTFEEVTSRVRKVAALGWRNS